MAELFDRFEINRMPRWPIMSRLVALSVVLHGMLLVAIFYIPTLRSVLHVAGSVAGLKFVSEDYDPTLVGERATVVQFPPHEKLYYPPDYFGAPEVAETTLTPEATVIQQAAPPPPPPVSYKPRRVRTPRQVAEPNPSPSPVSNEVAQAQPTPDASPTPEDEKQKAEEAELDKIAADNGVKRPPKINTKPFEDIGKEGKKLFDEGKLNLNSAIEVTAFAQLNSDGTLAEPVQLNWVTKSDQSTADLAQQLLTALSQSKVLGMLEGAKDVHLALKLDQQNISVKIMSDLASPEVAEKYAIGYGALLFAVRNKKEGTDEGALYKNLKVANDGSQFSISFEMPKDAAGKMIVDMLAKKAAKDAAAAAAAQSKS
jgi:outer membrane biosynthesis protein TonB